MTVDEGELSNPVEPLNRQRPHLLFHVSSLGHETVEPMTKLGLLAKSPTLTPRLDIATYYSGGDLLTFWYPYKRELDRGLSSSTQTPVSPVSEEMRKSMLEDIDRLDSEHWLKDSYKKIIEGADTFLPGERLRAVARINTPNSLVMILPENSDSFVSLYAEDKDKLILKVREAIEKMKIDFIDPTLNKDILAQDIVRTYIEHNILNIGAYTSEDRRILERNLSVLQKGTFDDPVYERYRRMLIARLQKKLGEVSENYTG